nr:hypothetical protein [Ardenticatena sp.]
MKLLVIAILIEKNLLHTSAKIASKTSKLSTLKSTPYPSNTGQLNEPLDFFPVFLCHGNAPQVDVVCLHTIRYLSHKQSLSSYSRSHVCIVRPR